MALESYRLVGDGGGKSLADWGFERATLQLGTCGEDRLTVSCASGINEPFKLTPDSRAELYAGGRCVLEGVVVPRREGFETVYEIRGLSENLNNTPVVQSMPFLAAGVINPLAVARCVLGKQSLSQDLDDFLAQVAASTGLSLAADHSLLPAPPEDGRPQAAERDVMAMQAIRNLFAYSPHLTWFADYSGSAIQIRTASVLRAGHGFAIDGIDLPANTDTHVVPISRIEKSPAPVFNPRYDLRLSEVKVFFTGYDVALIKFNGGASRWESVAEGTTGAVSALVWKQQVETATADNGSFRKKAIEVPLTRGAFNGEDYEGGETIITGLATRLLAAYAQLWYEFAWTEIGEGCNFNIRPGQLWSCTGGDPLYTDAQAFCNRVTHNLADGSTRAECGPPSGVGFLDPWLANRIRKVQSRGESGSASFGFERNDEDPTAGTGGESVFPIMLQTGTGTYAPAHFSARGTATLTGAPSTTLAVTTYDGSSYGRAKVVVPFPGETIP